MLILTLAAKSAPGVPVYQRNYVQLVPCSDDGYFPTVPTGVVRDEFGLICNEVRSSEALERFKRYVHLRKEHLAEEHMEHVSRRALAEYRSGASGLSLWLMENIFDRH